MKKQFKHGVAILSHYRVFGIAVCLGLVYLADWQGWEEVRLVAAVVGFYFLGLSLIGDIASQIAYSWRQGEEQALRRMEIKVLRNLKEQIQNANGK